MAQKNDRRKFIQKIAAVSSGALLASKAVFSSPTQSTNMENSSVTNIKPLGFQWETLDPFLFCVHHEDFYPKGNADMGPAADLEGRNLGQDFLIKDGWRMYHGDRIPGFPGHPHRGFETITVVRKGMVDHSDSLGAAGRYGDGDVQWMTAGKGVQHAEMFPLIHKDKENPLELFQIWLNLPKASKFADPHFKMFWKEDKSIYDSKDTAGKTTKVEVLVGTLDQHSSPTPPPDSWAADTTNEVAIWNVKMEAGAQWKLPPASKGVNRMVYFYEGNALTIGDKEIENYHSAELRADASLLLQNGDAEASVLIMQGRPINEPVVQHGPFVMNSSEELQQAFRDYQTTQFGGWPWPNMDVVHARDKGRFALHANGTLESKA